ncbi:MAG TPA: MFS transporter [Thermoplasmataceae archaeon]|nr:MFS transporter [Thermoplasmatales archaeon AK]HLH85898.1 MFS transporter [Thermoplasmataceae archaeon]
MTETKQYEGSVSDRLERLPFSKFHRNFLLMLTSGEWAESLMLLGNGAILGLVAVFYHLTGAYSAYALPVPFFLGEFVGSIFFGRLADARGRRAVFLYNQLIFGGGMLIAGFMPLWQLIALFVFIGGIGVGGEFPLVDSYGTEVFKGQQRGARLAMVYTIAVTAAPLIVFITSLTKPLGYFSFRIPLWMMGVAGFAVWAIRLRLTESPRWLETQGRFKEADQVMTHIEERVKAETGMKELPPLQHKSEPVAKSSKFSDIFAPDVRRTTIMMLIFQFFQSGIFYGFVTFAPGIITSKYPLHDPLGYAAVIFAGFFFGSIFNIFIIDKMERKWGIILFAILGGIFGTLFVIVNSLFEAVLFGFITTFALWNFSNFLHQYNAEVFPTRVRTTAAGTVYSVSRVSTSILTLLIAAFILPLGDIYVFVVIWIFVLICTVDLISLGPRTSRKRVEEIAV